MLFNARRHIFWSHNANHEQQAQYAYHTQVMNGGNLSSRLLNFRGDILSDEAMNYIPDVHDISYFGERTN